MKKLIGFIVASFLFAGIAHAQTIDTAGMTESDMRALLITLIEQLMKLEQQVLAQTATLAAQTAPAAPQAAQPTQALGTAAAPTQTQTTTMPEITKSISISQDGIQIFAVYSEDGQPVAGVPLTLTADDNGAITHSSVADKWATASNVEITHDVTVFNRPDFTIGAVFEYQPASSGPRTLTITGNGASQTVEVPGSIE